MIPTSYQPLDARPGETSAIDDQLTTDQPVDYTEMIREEAFIGDTPFEVIMEEITKQFEDYIDLKDKTNYVDVFYTQLHNSYAAVEEDDGEEHPVEIKEVLDKLQDEFESKMAELFTQRLTLTLAALEDEVIDREENEYIIRRLYEFFILGAKQNFLSVIAQDINARIDKIEDDRVYFNTVREMLTGFSPLVTVIGPMEFVKYRGDQEIYDLFNNGKVTGNFLRKYSPKLYNHEAFEVELINHITTLGQFTSGLAGEETT